MLCLGRIAQEAQGMGPQVAVTSSSRLATALGLIRCIVDVLGCGCRAYVRAREGWCWCQGGVLASMLCMHLLPAPRKICVVAGLLSRAMIFTCLFCMEWCQGLLC